MKRNHLMLLLPIFTLALLFRGFFVSEAYAYLDPGMGLGMSPDYFEYNPVYTANNDQCVLFCDSYGYEPQWAKSMGVYQAASKCTIILNDWENSNPDDQSWCTELAGYLVGQ